MSWNGKVSKKVMEDTELSVSARCLYALLCCYADRKSGTCFPSVNELRLKLGFKDRGAVSRHMKTLINKGYVTRIKKRGQNTLTIIKNW